MSISMDDKTLIRLLFMIIIGLIAFSANREISRVDRGVTVLHGRINATDSKKADEQDMKRLEDEMKGKATKEQIHRAFDLIKTKLDKEDGQREFGFVWKEIDKLRNKSCDK